MLQLTSTANIVTFYFGPLQPLESFTSSDGESSDSDSDARYYIVQYVYLYWLFKFGTTPSSEILNVSVLPFWDIGGTVGKIIINTWALSMFIGIIV